MQVETDMLYYRFTITYVSCGMKLGATAVRRAVNPNNAMISVIKSYRGYMLRSIALTGISSENPNKRKR